MSDRGALFAIVTSTQGLTFSRRHVAIRLVIARACVGRREPLKISSPHRIVARALKEPGLFRIYFGARGEPTTPIKWSDCRSA